jgi:hypothetical protein
MDQICATQAPSQREAVLDQEEQKSAKNGGKQLARTIKAASDLLQLDDGKFESASNIGSMVSGKTSKTTSGALDKHCKFCDNKRFAGKNWHRHVKSHKDKDPECVVEFSKCSGAECTNCKHGKYISNPAGINEEVLKPSGH